MISFPLSAIIGLALGSLFGCTAAVLYTIFLSGYRAALRDTAAGGLTERYRNQPADCNHRHHKFQQHPLSTNAGTKA